MENQKHNIFGIAGTEGTLPIQHPSVSAFQFIEESMQHFLQYVIIPMEILDDETISSSAKLLWGIYNFLDQTESGCFASQDYISEILKRGKDALTKLNKELKNKNLITNEFDGRKNHISVNKQIGLTDKSGAAKLREQNRNKLRHSAVENGGLPPDSYNKDDNSNDNITPLPPLKRGNDSFSSKVLFLYKEILSNLYQPRTQSNVDDLCKKIEARHKEMEWTKEDIEPWRKVFENCKTENFITQSPWFQKQGIAWLVRPGKSKGKLNLEAMYDGDYDQIQPDINKDGTMTDKARAEWWRKKEEKERRDEWLYNLIREKEEKVGDHKYWMSLPAEEVDELSREIKLEAKKQLDAEIAKGKI